MKEAPSYRGMQTLKQMGKVSSLKLVESTVYVLGEKQSPQYYTLDIFRQLLTACLEC